VGPGIIDTSRIEAMVSQLKAAAARAQPAAEGAQAESPAGRVDFAQVLKSSLDQVSNVQKTAQDLSQRFALGDDKVSLSDTMIAMQKSSISLQATIQVRNKLVSAYQDIMNMQV
jgi:flagellar hook-basal body complex protein FliE